MIYLGQWITSHTDAEGRFSWRMLHAYKRGEFGEVFYTATRLVQS